MNREMHKIQSISENTAITSLCFCWKIRKICQIKLVKKDTDQMI